MIFKDCYKTTMGSAFNTKNIIIAIKEAIIKDNIDVYSLGVYNEFDIKPVFITGLTNSEANIPLFTHPIMVITDDKRKFLCTDIRLFIRKDTDIENIESSIKNRTEYNLVKSRAILTLLWVNGQHNNIRMNLPFAGTVFSNWLSESISRTYSLDFKDQMLINILSSLYYQTLFMDDNDGLDEDTRQIMAIHTIKTTKASSELVYEVLDKITSIKNVSDYCELVKVCTENSRLKSFNLAVLLTIIKNSWYGTNAKELISIALEHPPTWSALVYTSLNERTYKSSLIYKIAERLGKRGISDEFISSYNELTMDMVGHESNGIRPLEIRNFE